MIHYLILAHKDFNQVELLIDKLKTNNSTVYLHVDGKVKDFPEFKNVIMIKNRVKTNWGGFSQIKTEVNGVKQVFENMDTGDHLVIISGQCWPIKKIKDIEKFINNLGNESCLFRRKTDERIIEKIDKYYFNDLDLHMPHLNCWLYNLIEKMGHNMNGSKVPVINTILCKIVNYILPRRKYLKTNYDISKGSNWIILSYKHTKWAMDFLKTDKGKKFYKSFRMTNCADEIFFQTMLYNSPLKNEIRNELLRYTKWESEKASSPFILTINDYDDIKKSGKLFARKFDINEDWEIIKKLESELK